MDNFIEKIKALEAKGLPGKEAVHLVYLRDLEQNDHITLSTEEKNEIQRIEGLIKD